MMIYVGILLGLILASACGYAFSLSFFIRELEDGTICEACSDRTSCFAKKQMRFFDSDYISEWMLFSFLKVRKKCPKVTGCSAAYRLLSFIVSFVLFWIPFWSKGYSVDGFLYGVMAITMLFLSIVDWNTQYIPLECNLFILLCGLIHLFADFSNWGDYIIGLFAVSGFLLLIDRLSVPVLRRKYEEELDIDDHVIGDGDIKLMAATGLLLGWKLNFIALGIGCVAGSVIHLIRMKIKGSNAMLALGPYLSLGVYITMICGEQLVSWYLNMLGIKPL